MNDKKLLATVLLFLALIGAGVWIYVANRSGDTGGTTPAAQSPTEEAPPQTVVAPDGGEIEPPPEDDDAPPDDLKVEQVKELELELSKLALEKPGKQEEVRSVGVRSLAIIDKLLSLQPMTSLRYAELLEERVTTTDTLAGLEGAELRAKEAMFEENLKLAREFAAKQPKLAVAHEVLGRLLMSSEGNDKAGAEAEFQECVKLEPTNGRCKQALATLK